MNPSTQFSLVTRLNLHKNIHFDHFSMKYGKQKILYGGRSLCNEELQSKKYQFLNISTSVTDMPETTKND